MLFQPEQWTPALHRSLPAPKERRGFITGIGATDTEPPFLLLQEILAGILYSLGYTHRSGGAPGSDDAVEKGVITHPHYRPQWDDGSPTMEIYLPKPGFNYRPVDPSAGYINAKHLPTYGEAQAIACRIHPLKEKLREPQMEGALMFHTRNVFQLLGASLDKPSDRVICAAPPTKDGLVAGGTRTAVALAKEHNVPVLNLRNEHTNHLLREFIDHQLRRLCPNHYRP